ncbi:hypothetical protein GUITHDRAFT_162455 [Guillardia theta CCMP2712]|uniref:TMC domain-containing protein n=1 Tax=Guillardia theta (strain CCMP2712) TaxID=905079 RepID=L1JIL2_GUITC|nr:hypothetical protein GUITHDRAFT_162455 [Guillardia theta CCMP2712]EKX48316.1 hypothetical protein GUITHDRAFT_162455 [Guillardia theta CCMP2712]|mmetsp:Transcript_50719/g.158455  ORF Transcript_50719/g.158455 Transcript_50719/m.158455 type:complete len:866 (-) Transcript_50719:515-3112(-)|eukprot:XP_005835296.1 hypothetical protein GUITHDRAFT_162455 [Guillardia theta CCMP2712]
MEGRNVNLNEFVEIEEPEVWSGPHAATSRGQGGSLRLRGAPFLEDSGEEKLTNIIPGQVSSSETEFVEESAPDLQLIEPKFGSFIPLEEFQEAVEDDLGGNYDELWKKDASEEKKKSFVPPVEFKTVVEDDIPDDDGARFGTEKDARRNQNRLDLQDVEKRLSRVDAAVSTLAKELAEQEEINQKLKKQLKRLRTDKVELEERLEDWNVQTQERGLVKASNAAEEKKFREVEARIKREEARRRAMELGLEYEQEDDMTQSTALGIMKLLRIRLRAFKTSLRQHDILYRQSRAAESRFGSGVSLYFWFYRWILQTTMWTVILLWLFVFIFHFIRYLSTRSFKMISIYPQFFFFSTVDTSMSTIYASFLFASVGSIVLLASYKVTVEYGKMFDIEVQNWGKEPQRYAKLAFTAWDWAIADDSAAQDMKDAISQNFRILKFEDELADRIRNRSQQEWTRLYVKRSVSLFFNFIALAGGWSTIIVSKFILFTGRVNNSSGLTGQLLALVPNIIPSAVNGIMPQVVDFCVDFEEWDDPAFVLKMRVSRLYAAKILNALIQVALVFILFHGADNLGLQRVLLRSCSYLTCEDQAGSTFFALFYTDVIINMATAYGFAVGFHFLYTKILNKPSLAKDEFRPSAQIIKVLYQQIFLWLSLPHFPFAIFIGFILWFLQFQVDSYILFNYNAKPVRPFDVKDGGVYFALFYSFTLFLFLGWFYYVWFIFSSSTSDLLCCRLTELVASGNGTSGACFAVNITASTCLSDALKTNSVAESASTNYLFYSSSPASVVAADIQSNLFFSPLLQAVQTPLLAWFLVSLILVLFFAERSYVQVLEKYKEEKINELNLQQTMLQRQIRGKERRISFAGSTIQ